MYVHISADDVRRMSFWILQITTCVFSSFLNATVSLKNLQIGDWIYSSTVRRGNGFKIVSRVSKKCSLKILLFIYLFLFLRVSFGVAAIEGKICKIRKEGASRATLR
jgi:hypothetical protein